MIEIDGENYFTASEVAKIVGVTDAKGKPLGRNKFINWMKVQGILMENNMPYQFHINMGLARLYRVPRNGRVYYITVFSQRGIDYILNKKS